MLKVGDPVPDFAFASEAFGSVSAASLRGKRYVMYFYPKDDTPGCTREACAFRDNLPRFGGLGIKVFGVSADDEKSHLRFARKHSLNFKLIPDPDHAICEAFGTWVEKNMYGRSYMGVARTTYVVAPDGKIEKVWEKVAPDGHAEEVFAWLNGDPIPLPVKLAPVVAKPVTVVKAAADAAKPAITPIAAAAAKVVKPVKAAAVKVAKPQAPIGVKPTHAQPAAKPTVSKPVVKTPAAKNAVVKKIEVKKVAVNKAPINKAEAKPVKASPASRPKAKKPEAKKPLPKKAAAKKPASKPVAKKAPAKKVVAAKGAGNRVVVKKAAAKKPLAKKPVAKSVAKKKLRR